MYILYYTPSNYCSHFFLQYTHIQSFIVNLHIFLHFQPSFSTFFAFRSRFRLFFNTFSSFSRRLSLIFSTFCLYLFFFCFYLQKQYFIPQKKQQKISVVSVRSKKASVSKPFHHISLHKNYQAALFSRTKKCQNTAKPHHGISFCFISFFILPAFFDHNIKICQTCLEIFR